MNMKKKMDMKTWKINICGKAKIPDKNMKNMSGQYR